VTYNLEQDHPENQTMSSSLSCQIAARWPLVAVAATLMLALSARAAEAKKAGGAPVPAATAAMNESAKPTEAAAIRATADAFVAAFNRGDVKAVAALWTADGSLVDDQGRLFQGRQAIENEYAALFKQYPGAKIEIAVQNVELPAAGTAVEDGLARVTAKDGETPTASRYTAVHVRVDGRWLMASVRESGIELPSGYGHLRDLEWLVGQWEAKSPGAAVRTTFRWIANKSYLQREYTVRKNGLTTSSGTQIIGWDPQAGKVRSWSFDSSGGYGTSLWTPTAQGWRMESRGVLADGTPTAAQDFVVRVPNEDNVFGWRSVHRMAGGRELPDLGEMVLERLQEKR
jgi:uncharacterized protein (TIGR02246 family)